jgi:biopolymer transport protein ExbB/TolQ
MKRFLHYLGATAGVLLALSPFFVTVFGMLRAFSVLGKNGISDPRALSGAIGEVLVSAVISMIVMPLGATLAAWCIVQILNQRRPKSPPPLPRRPHSSISDSQA